MKSKMSLNHKIETLVKIAIQFNQNHIRWNLGASCMLYLRGIAKKFHDIDILIHEDDVQKVKEIMSSYTLTKKTTDPLKYRTKVFLNYDVDGVDFDLMARFSIVDQEKIYEFPLLLEDMKEYILVSHEKVYVSSIETWLNYYQLMHRYDKVEMIKDYLQKHLK